LIADMFGDGGAGNTTTIKHGCVTGNQGVALLHRWPRRTCSF
jgi:hypothetical protein